MIIDPSRQITDHSSDKVIPPDIESINKNHNKTSAHDGNNSAGGSTGVLYYIGDVKFVVTVVIGIGIIVTVLYISPKVCTL